ncbi:MAG: hypothetical protein PHO32_03930 [Candidatus Cloacimonetes bacterium]|nr:hypothetical protein [Candidatus Cloacimonadota bacterium]
MKLRLPLAAAKLAILAILLLPLALCGNINQELVGADSLYIGSPFSFIIHADYTIESIPIPDTLESFAVIRNQQLSGKPNSWELKLAPLRTGALSFPKLPVLSSKKTETIDSTDAFRVYVLSTLAEGDTLLRDIKPLERYPFQLHFLVYVLLILIALGLLTYIVIMWRKRKKMQKQAQKVATTPQIIEKPIPAWQIAVAELENLLKENLVDKGDILRHHFRLSEILRRFLESRYRFAALEMTVSEIAQYMGIHRIYLQDEVLSFLVYCDMVKFAKAQPALNEIAERGNWLMNYFLSFRDASNGVS